MEGLDAFADVSRETSDKLLELERLITKWNPAINLISKGTLAFIRERHILDSMQIYNVCEKQDGLWCDIGSGGGFPGLVAAVLAIGDGNSRGFHLVESDTRKAVFLREAIRTLKLNAKVFVSRIEELPSQHASVLTARALAPLDKLCEFANIHLAADGVAIFPKGASHQEEIETARRLWRFDLEKHQSITDPSSAVLVLRNIRHA